MTKADIEDALAISRLLTHWAKLMDSELYEAADYKAQQIRKQVLNFGDHVSNDKASALIQRDGSTRTVVIRRRALKSE